VNVCGLCEEQLEHGHLCSSCTLATLERINRMPGLWRSLESFLAPGSSAGLAYGRTPMAEAPLPVSEDALNLRAVGGIVGVLEDWWRAMRADRGWARPVKDRPDGDGVAARVEAAARALAVNLEWMAAYWWPVAEFAQDLRRLEAEVLSIVDPRDPRERGRRYGYCVTVDQDGNVCGAVLRLYEGETALTCRWCRYVYQPVEFLLLKHFQPDEVPGSIA
jgi:hypothetical protein